MTFFRRTAIAFLALTLPLAAYAASGDDRFLAARDAYRAGDRAKLERLAPELRSHDLDAYVEYWLLTSRLPDQLDTASAREFLAKHEKTHIAEKLRVDWLKVLGKKQQWAEFDSEYPKVVAPDQDLACFALQSRRARGDTTMLDDAMPLWLSLMEPPASCYPVLEALIWEKRVLADEAWARVRRQVEANKIAAARYSTNYLPPSQTPTGAQLDAALERAMPMLAKLPSNWAEKRMGRELVAIAIQRIARNDPRQAAEQLEKLGSRLEDSERGWAWSQIGWQAATRHMSEAVGWYKPRPAMRRCRMRSRSGRCVPRCAARLGYGAFYHRKNAAGTRCAARMGLLAWAVPTRPGADDRGRCPVQEDRRCSPTFTATSPTMNWSDRSTSRRQAASPTRDEVVTTAANPGLKRALALLRVNMRVEGVREWNWTLRGMSDRELLAAAELAKRNDVYDRAIAAADRTKNEHDYSLRYLSPLRRPCASGSAVSSRSTMRGSTD
jgi:soluble lytic murein transglycosylase